MEPMVAVYPFERNSCGANGGSLSFGEEQLWSQWWQSILLRGTVVEPMVAVYPFERNSCGADGGSLSF